MSENRKKNIKDIGSKIKEFALSPYPRPKRDWLFILSSFFAILFLMAMANLSIFFYYKYFYESPKDAVDGSSYEGDLIGERELGLDREKTDKVWDFFKDKEVKFELVRNEWGLNEPLQNGVYTDSADGESEGGEDEEGISDIETILDI